MQHVLVMAFSPASFESGTSPKNIGAQAPFAGNTINSTHPETIAHQNSECTSEGFGAMHVFYDII